MEIKFKVWDSHVKMFLDEQWGFYINQSGDLCYIVNGLSEKASDNFEPVFSMTTLDKNGVEWKEGDICKSITGNNMVLIHEETEYPGWKFEYLSGTAKGMKVSAHVNALSKEEIIGNKFENPELIEDRG